MWGMRMWYSHSMPCFLTQQFMRLFWKWVSCSLILSGVLCHHKNLPFKATPEMVVWAVTCSTSVNNDLGTSEQNRTTKNNKMHKQIKQDILCILCASEKGIAYPHGLLLQLYENKFLFCIVLQIPLNSHTMCRSCWRSYRQNTTPSLKSEDQSLCTGLSACSL